MKSVLFMVEGGPALDLVKKHIMDVRLVRAHNRLLAEELGVTNIFCDRRTGVLSGVEFGWGTPVHPDFKKPSRKGACYPKKGTAWEAKFKAQVGYTPLTTLIEGAFKVPLSLNYATPDGKGCGGRCIGSILNECGFLYPSGDGPYAMWVPDVVAEVAAIEAEGYVVEEPAKSFKMEFEGCRRIEGAEWEILVLQHKLAEKKVVAA